MTERTTNRRRRPTEETLTYTTLVHHLETAPIPAAQERCICMSPKKRRSPCSVPRCPKLTEGRYCDEHKRRKWSGDNRPSARERGYVTRWDKARKRYAAKHPLCEPCEAEGFTVPVQIVDHIIPIRKGGAKFDFGNLQSMCRPCHAKKTAHE